MMIPYGFTDPEDQRQQHSLQKKPSGISLADINWRGIAVFVLLSILFLVAWTVIREIAGVGSGFGAAVMGWFREASINPEQRAGFTSFLKLLLTAGFIGLLIFILGRK
jgi:hypothetical protein